MKNNDIFQLISGIIQKASVRCILIGGFAVNYYKVTRYTADVDFLITETDFDNILDLLLKKGFKIDYRNNVFVRLNSDNEYIMALDFMFVDEDVLSKIVKDGKVAHIGKYEFMVPSVRHLIALKLHAIKYNPNIREYKDLVDIIDLTKANKIDINNNNFKELCLKYGTKELYNKILEAF